MNIVRRLSTIRILLPTNARSAALALVVLAVAVIAVTGTVVAASGGLGPDKAAAFTQVAAEQETAQAGYHAPKPTGAPPSPASCPYHGATGIYVSQTPVQTPFHKDGAFYSTAGAFSSVGDYYMIYAGATRSDPQQGVLYVEVSDRDPCADSPTRAAQYSGLKGPFLSPFRQGALTLTQIVGDTVDFTTADGGSGSFNYVSGTYL